MGTLNWLKPYDCICWKPYIEIVLYRKTEATKLLCFNQEGKKHQLLYQFNSFWYKKSWLKKCNKTCLHIDFIPFLKTHSWLKTIITYLQSSQEQCLNVKKNKSVNKYLQNILLFGLKGKTVSVLDRYHNL